MWLSAPQNGVRMWPVLGLNVLNVEDGRWCAKLALPNEAIYYSTIYSTLLLIYSTAVYLDQKPPFLAQFPAHNFQVRVVFRACMHWHMLFCQVCHQ